MTQQINLQLIFRLFSLALILKRPFINNMNMPYRSLRSAFLISNVAKSEISNYYLVFRRSNDDINYISAITISLPIDVYASMYLPFLPPLD